MGGSELDQVRRSMLEQALLFDDPYSYRCGVEDALAAIVAIATGPDRPAKRVVDRGAAPGTDPA